MFLIDYAEKKGENRVFSPFLNDFICAYSHYDNFSHNEKLYSLPLSKDFFAFILILINVMAQHLELPI